LYQVLPSSDPLDRPDLNVVDYINTLFPTEQSLAGLDETIGDLNARVEEIEQETRNMVRSQVGLSRLFSGFQCCWSVRIRIQLFN
jgi:hypothetical protein